MTKIIKEMLPPDVRVARDAQDLLIECCVGENLIIELYSFYVASFFTQYYFTLALSSGWIFWNIFLNDEGEL